MCSLQLNLGFTRLLRRRLITGLYRRPQILKVTVAAERSQKVELIIAPTVYGHCERRRVDKRALFGGIDVGAQRFIVCGVSIQLRRKWL